MDWACISPSGFYVAAFFLCCGACGQSFMEFYTRSFDQWKILLALIDIGFECDCLEAPLGYVQSLLEQLT